MTKPKADRRTPRELAQERLDVADRKLAANRKTRADLTARLTANRAQEAELIALVEYLAKHPALRTEREAVEA
jgi:hypothetical protein